MKIIKLPTGAETIVDDVFFEVLSQYKWQYNLGYAEIGRASCRERV